ncbi:MAG: hypothetical protein QOI10_1645 [Solirubrobacterales bacterium]|jgi:DNA-binding CsgD family transcriptional regulator|nr:hypothetical protein [Solirubrobacterales bacterium]
MDLPTLLGRGEEQDVLKRAVTDARLGSSRVVLLTGEPGIGKTALLDWSSELARSQGMEVLSARGIESEAEAPFGGLLELLRPALDELDRIPAAQADALRSALDLGPTAPRDRFVIGAATLNLLSVRSENAPILVVVDDAHWLDDSSLAALLFAARRLLVDPVAVIFAARSGEAPALEAARLSDLRLNGVDPEAAAGIVARHAGSAPTREAVERLGRATAGNPLALVELSSSADLGDGAGDDLLEIETSVAEVYARRIENLAESTRRTLALAAAEESGRLDWIGAAADQLGLPLFELEAAERVGLISISFGSLSWRHPLARSAAYRGTSAGDRRAMHAALAGAVGESGTDRRAWHRAAAVLGTDEEVAAELERAAKRARSRSAYAAAATAATRAAQLSPDENARTRRLYLAAEAAWLGGDAKRALSNLDLALSDATDTRMRAEIQHLRGQALIRAGEVMAAHAILIEGAEAIEAIDPSKAVVMLAEATDACVYAGRPEAMLAPARRARELLPAGAGERERFFASLALGTALIYDGQGDEGTSLLREAVTVLEASDALSGDPRLLSAAALGPLWLREAETGTSLIDRAIELARRDGALGTLPFALALAGRDAATSDRWAIGRGLYEEAIELARETDQAMPLASALAWLASILARQGESEASEACASEALALAEAHGLGLVRVWGLDPPAELELALGRLETAVERFEGKRRALADLGLTDPDLSPTPELVEAHVRSGSSDGLTASVKEFAAQAEGKGQPWALARLARCRGLLADAAGFQDEFETALTLHGATRDGFERARTRLCFGERLRRAGQRVRARDQLRAALDAFDGLGAAPWAERARTELLATGETARRRDPSTLDDLTPQELQIGLLLAGGQTTREAAAKLFLSPKTIEYHLRNVYRKLEIHSRDELARELAEADSGSPRGTA